MCSSQSVPQIRMPCVGRGETARTPERFTQAKALSSESFISEAKGRPRQTPPPGFSPNPAPRSRSWGARGSRIVGGRGSPGREEGWRSRDVEWELGGAWGRGLGSAGEAELGPEAPPRGCTAARPVIPLAALPGPAHLQWLRESAPAPPRPGLEPSLSRGRRRSWSCCRIPAGPPPLSLPLAGHLDPGLRTARVPETLPAQLRGPAPHGPPFRLPCPDFRLLLDPRFPSLSSPPPQAWPPVGGRGVCALRRPRPAPRDSPCMAGPGGRCGGARAPCGGVTKGVAVPVPV